MNSEDELTGKKSVELGAILASPAIRPGLFKVKTLSPHPDGLQHSANGYSTHTLTLDRGSSITRGTW